MNHETIFSFANSFALGSWILLIFLPNWIGTRKLVRSGVASLLLSFSYLCFVIVAVLYSPSEGGFNSLQEVMTLFEDKTWVLAGWVHYLAFDLFVGIWIVGDAQKQKIKHLLLIPILGFTFMLGPIGLCLYFLLKTASKRTLLEV